MVDNDAKETINSSAGAGEWQLNAQLLTVFDALLDEDANRAEAQRGESLFAPPPFVHRRFFHCVWNDGIVLQLVGLEIVIDHSRTAITNYSWFLTFRKGF